QECRSYLIKLTGLSTETDEDYLTFHLESKEQVEVQDVKMNEDQTSAIVNLQSQMDVEKILKKNHLEIEGSTITAEAYIPEDSSAIEVKGDPDIINEDNAEMLFWYFSNTSRSGGGNIVECSVQSGVAHFTFETSNVAKQVLEKKNHIFRKHPLDVKLFKPEQTCKHRNTLLVSDIPEGKGIDDDYLVLFFENKNNFGDNVHVTNTEYDEQNGTALVEFRDQTSLDVVLQRQPLSMKSKVIKVNMYPLRTVDGTLSVISTNEEQFEYEVSGRVSQLLKRAQKLPRVKSNIQQFFQQAKNVKAEMTKPSVFDPGIHSNNQSDNCKKVQITNLPDKADKEFILLYFENQLESSKYQLVDVETDTENACAILHFDKPEAAEYIIEKQPFVLKQQQVFAKKYLASKQGTVMVRGIDDMNENIDTLQLYFKNERKSDGGKIAYLHVDEETNCAYITFENEQVAKRVVQRKRHVLRSKELEVVLVSSKENKPCVENEKDKRYHKIPENNNVEKLQVEQELERKVWLSNVPAGTDKDFLKWYFEDQFDGVKIKKVEIYCDISCAFVEVFKVSEAKIILREKAVKMKNTEVSINKYSSICTIEVIGSTNTELEMEKMLCYFKNEKQSGGGAVVKHSTDDSKTAAYFMFETHKVADRVVNHDHREFEITVSVLGKNIENCMPIETIKVKGITQEITKQDLQLYFETYERSGGGEIECITYITTDNSVALVKFRKAEDAKVVTKRRKHVIENCTLTAVLHHPPPFYETKVLLKGLVHTSPSFDLLDFFESNMGSRPKSVTYHLTEDNTALVTMEKNIDFEKLQKACDKERSLGITRVTQSTCILISKLGNDVSTDEIKYYFEKKCGHRTRRVEKMVPERSNGTCLIYFESYQ
ncbi:uncharacterized protein LOC128553206, partial [Mercenaria mercenaria]|uniref:uncharacterized protein LOC128553206 n=1 Tax=Mercenaria mercenaria TaxID=6596 RepID=UPI00234FAD6A